MFLKQINEPWGKVLSKRTLLQGIINITILQNESQIVEYQYITRLSKLQILQHRQLIDFQRVTQWGGVVLGVNRSISVYYAVLSRFPAKSCQSFQWLYCVFDICTLVSTL